MPTKFEFDDTRNAIGADNLKDSERKAMLDKFKSAGGKVLSERELREQKAKETQLKQGSQSSKQSGSKNRYGGASEEEESSSQKKEAGKPQNAGTISRIFLRLKAFFEGITPFTGEVIKPSFISYLGLEVKQAVVEFNLIGNDLFLLNRNVGKKIAHILDEKNPMLLELLQRLHSLFDVKDFNSILDFHANNPGSNIPFNLVRDPIKNLYRKLYYIYPFQETIKKALMFAVDIYVKETRDDDNNNKNLMEQKKKKFLKDVNEVFLKAFPKLFTLISRMDGIEYIPFSLSFEKAMGISQDDKIGKRKQGESTSLATNFFGTDSENAEADAEAKADLEEGKDTEEGESEQKKEISKITTTKEYQYGMKLMKQNPLPGLRQKHDTHKKYLYLQYNDRAFLAYMFFLEFDRELSFVLTTKKITLAADYSTGAKKDYKQILADAFNQSRSVIQSFENYADARKTFQSYEKAQSAGSNYVEAAKRKEGARAKMDIEGRNVRGLIRAYMDNVTKIMATLIADMKGNKTIVQNMDDPLIFDSEFEGSKRLNGQPVKQCILETYCYSLALYDRLTNGDLFGGILDMTDEEMLASFGSTYKEPA